MKASTFSVVVSLSAIGLMCQTLYSRAADATQAAPEVSERCAAIVASVEEAGFSDVVTVTCDGEQAYLSSNSYPDHDLMTGIVGTNEQVPIPAWLPHA